MAFEAKNYDGLLGTEGFSDTLLKNHFTLYQGYVTNSNKLMDTLSQMLKDGKTGVPEYNELKRRFGWEYNGMVLHEYYFDNMVKGGVKFDENSPLYKKIVEDFGSFEMWEKDFTAVATMRGIGWALLFKEPKTGKLLNVWINEHDVGHLAGAMPLMICDVFEHAYITDYGIKRADYMKSFYKCLDWGVIAKRFK